MLMNTTCKFISYTAPMLALAGFSMVACSDNGQVPAAMGGQANGASGAPTSGTSSGGQTAAGTTSGGVSTGGMAGTSTSAASGAGSGGGGSGSGGSAGSAAGGGGGGAGGSGGMGGAGGSNGGSGQGGVGGTHMGPVTGMGAYVRTGWTAVYTCTGTCPTKGPNDMNDSEPNAFDGMANTRWSTGVYQDKMMAVFPLYFTVDMKQINSISKMTFNAGGDPFDAPGEMDVLVSNDGTNFTPVLTAYKTMAPSKGMTETVMLPAGTVGQFIKLKGTKTIHQVDSSLNDRYWAIGEMNVYP
jgi:hypothetical protein